MKEIFHGLNKQQQEAVLEIQRPVLILAGAGSGKTKTITSRLAYLIAEVGIDPGSILTLTFTNKAASSMRERAMELLSKLDKPLNYPPLLCTFHKFGLLFLKFHINLLGRNNNFVVIDTDDKKRIIKSLLGTESTINQSKLRAEISNYKNLLLSPHEVSLRAQDEESRLLADAYAKYQEYLANNNLVDFDDLLSLTYRILDENPEVCQKVSQRYQYIMVDEYQDTNDLQYELLRKLCGTSGNLCVVGDDDQSIYQWRGANIRNILDFADNFPDTKVIKLEQNYRSSNQILKLANELISHNRERLGKKLISVNGDAKEVELLESLDDKQEASIIAKKVSKLINKGVNPNKIAILYRINALSRALEIGLSKEGVAFKMVGGVKFYERSEIKDIVSYLRLITNPHDDFSFMRVINRPKRGVGKVALDKLKMAAFQNKISLYQLIKNEDLIDILSKKSLQEMQTFVQNIDDLIEISKQKPYELIDQLDEKFNLREFYASNPDGEDRERNIYEFYGYYKEQIISDLGMGIEEFLNELSLQSDQDQIDGEKISIMSIHAAKGLEFDHVFVVGLEESFFPLLGDSSDIEEERRLGYVAITRAKKELSLSYVKQRFYKGKKTDLSRSRFLVECGICEGSFVLEKKSEFRKGDLVKHKIFGIGRILEVERMKADFKLCINFGGTQKSLMASFVEKVV